MNLGDSAGLLGRVERRVAERCGAENARRTGLTLLVARLAGARRLVDVDAVGNLRSRVERTNRITIAATSEDDEGNGSDLAL